ncbi:hypothetical protein CHELA20_40124 [Hyphomicrobiales bacterium]|nr:hypothetical protein CHELA20_40124 [Hyphomicrobiales bacterium]CAH1687083.1 hypothetical protein CHELA41_30112 [Hyphomicrobiales bacterium]
MPPDCAAAPTALSASKLRASGAREIQRIIKFSLSIDVHDEAIIPLPSRALAPRVGPRSHLDDIRLC